MSANPPFRADIVGSFLRPEAVKNARAEAAAGRLNGAELKLVEDQEIAALVAKEEAAGLQVATDGEFRRAWWHYDFLGALDGVELVELDHGIQFQGVQTKSQGLAIRGKLSFPPQHRMLDDFRYLERVARGTPKMTIPSPSVLHFRLEKDAVDGSGYGDRDDIFDDLARTYRDAVAAFYAAGCRYLQFDDTAWAYLCSDVELAKARDRGINTDRLGERYAALINACLLDKPDDMVVTTHVCRGNFRSTWISSGGYEPVAEQLLGVCNYDGYFLEYDSERAGSFDPLRFLPEGSKTVVLGLVTTKSGELEQKDAVIERIQEATRFVAIDQLALSPQCGFASTEEGNVLTEDEQWSKVREVVDIANEVWG